MVDGDKPEIDQEPSLLVFSNVATGAEFVLPFGYTLIRILYTEQSMATPVLSLHTPDITPGVVELDELLKLDEDDDVDDEDVLDDEELEEEVELDDDDVELELEELDVLEELDEGVEIVSVKEAFGAAPKTLLSSIRKSSM